MKRAMILAVLALALSPWALRADIITIDDGRKFEGTATTEGDQVIVKTKMGTLTFPKDKVVSIEKVKGVADTYREKADALKAGDAEGHWQLAQWCKENKLIREMNAELEKTIAASPDHEQARSALNYVKVDDKWVKAKAGMVWVDGAWTKPDEALDKAKQLYKVEKYTDAYKAFDGALKCLKKDDDVADAQLGLGMCAERLGKWGEAKGAYAAILGMKGAADLKGPAEARKAVIDSSTGGMYLVKETAGRDDIFSLDNDKKDKIKKLSGLQSLTNPDVFDIALREKCSIFIEKGKELMKQARDANTGSADGDKKTLEFVDKANEQFKTADRLVKDIARGYLIECVKQHIAVVGKPFDLKINTLQGRYNRLQAEPDPKQKMALAKAMLPEFDDLLKALDPLQKLAAQYPDELAIQVANFKQLRSNLTSIRAQLAGFAGAK